jgi:membrane-bound ClpP family serine protease
MNTISRTISGWVMIVLGAFLLGGSFFWEGWIVSIIYGIILFILGFFVLFNKKEDEIEKIKKIKNFKMKGGKNG